jgi:hypothetical protein
MGAVVWDTVLDTEIPSQTTLGDLNPLPSSNQHHHHYHYPGGLYHSLSNLAPSFSHQKTSTGELVSWTPAWLSGRTLQIDGVTVRPHLKGDSEPMREGDTVSNGVDKETKVKSKSVHEDNQCQKCASQGFGSNSTTNIIRGERKIGAWRRLISLPVGCDLTSLRAKLEAGLLQISVSKNDGFPPEGARTIEIE